MHMERSDVTAGEKRLLEVLRERGPQTLDELCALPDFDWAQVLMAVDRLSRTGDVVLELVGPCEYHVSLGRGNS
jgi:predicted transcriptional regulator